MPRDHGRILVSIWDDPDFIDLTPSAQRLYMLLLSQRGINNAGLLPTQIGKWAKRSRHTNREEVEDALAELCDSRFVVCDDYTEETLIRSFIRNDGIAKQPNVLKNALRCAEAIESPRLRTALAAELRRLGRADASEVADRIDAGSEADPDDVSNPSGTLPEPFEKPSRNPAGRGKGKVVTHLSENSSKKDSSRARASAPARENATIEEAIEKPGPVVPIDGRRLVRARIPSEHPPAVHTELSIQAAALLKAGTPVADVEAALDLWLTKPGTWPSKLPNLVSEVIIRNQQKPTAATAYVPPDQRPLTKREQEHIRLELMKDHPNPDVLRQFGIDPVTRQKALPGAAAS